MSAVIIDYGSGNLHSVEKAVSKAATELQTDEVVVSSDPDVVAAADRLILPGVGAFSNCRRALLDNGLDGAIEHAAIVRRAPFLGICVGMQLLAELSLEHGRTQGFGWIAGEVRALERTNSAAKIPHMGWNSLHRLKPHPLLAGVFESTDVYFVHSFHFAPINAENCIAQTLYGSWFAAIVASGNIAGTQFHPEKSQKAGQRLLGNFLKWKPV